MGVNSLPKTVTRQRRDCDLNPGPSAPESSTLNTRLPSHPALFVQKILACRVRARVSCRSGILVTRFENDINFPILNVNGGR